MKTNQDYKNAALAALNPGVPPVSPFVRRLKERGIPVITEIELAYQAVKPQHWITITGTNGKTTTTMKFDPTTMSTDEIFATMRTLLGVMGISFLLYIFLLYPLTLGFMNTHRKLLVEGDNNLSSNMFSIAFDGYGRKVWGMFLMALFTMLWTLLFIIPGIVKAFAYAMTPYILEEHPELSANEAIDRSVAMMKGHKFDLFYLILSFIGWGLLCIPTLMIGTLWLTPYIYTSMAAFYEDVKADYEQIAMD